MENNSKDFMKNRPVVSSANQYKDVYGSASKGYFNFVTVLLAVIIGICSILSFVKNNALFGSLFLFVFIVLIISIVVAYISNKNNKPPIKKSTDDTEAIFKDHDI